ncbi:MAG: TetR/AcrR family transcriptional regulator [Actinomycetia bacterium]|nr:TetR/AcrR family transcriptional regulator [Actinomycetes bacterium]
MSTAPETRARLIHHGRMAFAAKGHDRVSLHRDVLLPAGVSNGSFYHQFRDKTDLLVAVLEDAVARGRFMIEQSVQVSPDTPPVERVRRTISLWLDLVDVGEDSFRIQMQERNSSDERVRRLVADLRQRSYAPLAERLSSNRRLLSESFDGERAAQLVTGLATAMAMDYLALPKDQRAAERDDLAGAMASFIIGGVTGVAGTSNPSGVATA